ncbi:MAG TPA: ABC transporter ATP-binding protein [Stellaceae bacterium]|jgi:peptide/nickel transport system ATP-binding protein|nr:ABC transporter ATP-binding protein [Stellaceae bacterium]
MSEPPAVEVADLRVRFRQRERVVHAVNGIGFSLARGEVLGILGESGSGKSVTLRALMRLLPDNCEIDGRIEIGGEDLNNASTARLEQIRGGRVAMIFQEPMTALDPVFTIGDQIAETVVRHEGVSRRDARRRALELLEQVQIPSARRRLASYPHEMSGGMRQRAMIAVALCCNPSVLLADEPTTALDVTVQIQILLLLRELQRERGMAVIFVTHDVGAAVEVSDRLAVMYAGRFVESGAAGDVIRHAVHPYTQGLLAANLHGAEPGTRLATIVGAPPDLSTLPGGCSFAPRCTHATLACAAGVPAAQSFGGGHVAHCVRADSLVRPDMPSP